MAPLFFICVCVCVCVCVCGMFDVQGIAKMHQQVKWTDINHHHHISVMELGHL